MVQVTTFARNPRSRPPQQPRHHRPPGFWVAPLPFLAALVWMATGPSAAADTAAAAHPGGAADGADAVPSRITAVTIHPEQARVTREAEVSLQAGEQHVILKPLPATLDTGSVRVGGRGIAGLAIRGVEIRVIREEAAPAPETADLERTIRDLSRQSALALQRKRSLGVLRDFVTGLKAAAVDTTSREILTRGFATADWESAFEFLSGHLDRVADEEDRVDHEYGDLSRSLATAQARLAETASRRAPERYAADILVSAKSPGAA